MASDADHVVGSRPQLLALGLGAAGVLAVLAAGAWMVRESVYLSVAPAVAGSPALAAVARVLAPYGPLLLAGLAAVLAVRALWRDRPSLYYLLAGGLGVLGAYLVCAGLKLLVTEDRPCRVWDAPTALSCPGVGNWSWPSGHSVLAAALATACIIAVPRIAWLAVPLALVAGLARLVAGVHYLHDVAAGLALGTAVVVGTVVVLRRATGSAWPAPSDPDR